jgi:hypothetical protein
MKLNLKEMNFIIIIILKTITKLKINRTTLNKINDIHSISLNDLCNNHLNSFKIFILFHLTFDFPFLLK